MRRSGFFRFLAVSPGWSDIAVLPIYLAVSLVVTYPLLPNLNRAVLGDGDAWLFVWNFWWWRFALGAGLHPFCTDYVHYPTGICAYLHTWNLVNTWPSLLLQPFLSITTLYNVFALAGFVLAAWGMYRLARFSGLGGAGAFLAGLAFSFNGYHYAEANGHLNLMTYQWIPFFLQALMRGVTAGWTARTVAAASVWLVLVALSEWYYLLFCVVATALLVLVRWFHDHRGAVRAAVGASIVVALSSIAVSPLLTGMLRQAGSVPEERVASAFSANLASFILPGPATSYSGLLGGFEPWSRFASEASFPWSVILLAPLGFSLLRGWDRLWPAVWIPCFLVLSLGPVLHVGARVYDSVPLPYAWLEQLPGFFLVRAPIRFHVLTWVGLALLYGSAADRLAAGGRRRLRVGLLAGVLLAETLSVPFGLSRPDVSPFYKSLASEPGGEAVIDLHYNSRALYYQTIHRRKIMGLPSIVSRQTRSALAYLRETPGIRELLSENTLLFFQNSWPSRVFGEANPFLTERFSLIMAGYARGSGEFSVESALPHITQAGDPAVMRKGVRTTGRLSAGDLLVVRLSLRRADLSTGHAPVRIWVSNQEVEPGCDSVESILPTVRMPLAREGLTCLFYPDVTLQEKAESEAALERIKKDGFGWILIPFYGNDHFVREVLGLAPVFQDRWLSAFRVPGASPPDELANRQHAVECDTRPAGGLFWHADLIDDASFHKILKRSQKVLWSDPEHGAAQAPMFLQ